MSCLCRVPLLSFPRFLLWPGQSDGPASLQYQQHDRAGALYPPGSPLAATGHQVHSIILVMVVRDYLPARCFYTDTHTNTHAHAHTLQSAVLAYSVLSQTDVDLCTNTPGPPCTGCTSWTGSPPALCPYPGPASCQTDPLSSSSRRSRLARHLASLWNKKTKQNTQKTNSQHSFWLWLMSFFCCFIKKKNKKNLLILYLFDLVSPKYLLKKTPKVL